MNKYIASDIQDGIIYLRAGIGNVISDKILFNNGIIFSYLTKIKLK